MGLARVHSRVCAHATYLLLGLGTCTGPFDNDVFFGFSSGRKGECDAGKCGTLDGEQSATGGEQSVTGNFATKLGRWEIAEGGQEA